MPRVNPSGLRRPADRCDGLGFGVPAYAHPLVAPGEWAQLARPKAPVHWVVLNAARGPGARVDPLCAEACARLRDAAVPVLGYLDTRHGARPFGQLVADAHRFLDWYRVDGFFLDRAPTTRSELTDCRRVITTLRALLSVAGGSTGHVVLGHGCHPHESYAEAADQLVTFAGPWSQYRWSQAPEWTAAYPPERFCHLVHGVPAPHLETAMRIARWQGAATVYFTDRTDHAAWDGLPGYWDEASRMLRRQPPPSM